jgi:hypothetical protein
MGEGSIVRVITPCELRAISVGFAAIMKWQNWQTLWIQYISPLCTQKGPYLLN